MKDQAKAGSLTDHSTKKTGKMQNSIRKGHHIEHSSASSSHITRATLKSLFRELPKTLWLDSVGIGMQITFQVLCKCEERYQKFRNNAKRPNNV